MVRREAHTGEDVLRAAFLMHYAALIRLCLALGEQLGDAEDIVQEAYVRAAPSLHELQPGVVRAYLRRIALNIRHDRHRRVAGFRLPHCCDADKLRGRRRSTRGPLGRPQSPTGSPTRVPRAALLRRTTRARDSRTSWLLRRDGQEPHASGPVSASTGGRTMRIEEQLVDAIDKHVGTPRAGEAAWSDLQRRVASTSTAEVARGTSRRLVAAIVAFAVFGGAVALLWVATSSNPITPSVSSNQLATIPVGWTRLPLPPGENHGTTEVWTRDTASVVGRVRGGRDKPVAEGFAFDAITQRWLSIPPAPAAKWGAEGCVDRFGSDLPRWGGTAITRNPMGLPSIPRRRRGEWWPAAPVDTEGAVVVWTGLESIAWGGGKSGEKSNSSGKPPDDPSTDTWRRGPPTLPSVSTWRAECGPELSSSCSAHSSIRGTTHRRRPRWCCLRSNSNTWREIAPSHLSPQADAAVWQGDRLVAYDYLWKAAAYTPSTDAWKVF